MELPVAALEGLRHPLHGVHDSEAADEVHVHPGGVPHEAQHRLILSLGDMHLQALLFQPVDKLIPLLLSHSVFQYHDHCLSLRFPALLIVKAEIKNAAQV